MRKPRRKVRQRSIEWFERDVPGMHMDEVLFRQNFEFSRAAGHFPATAARVQRFSAVYTNTFTSKVSRALDKPNPELLGQDKPRLELAVG